MAGDGTVRVWAADGSPVGEPMRGHDGAVHAVAVGTLAGEQVIVSGGDDGTVRVWAADGSPRGEPLRGHDRWVNAVALGTLADEQVIVSAGDDGTVRVWAAAEETAIAFGDSIRDVALLNRGVLVCGPFGLACLDIIDARD